MRGGALPPALLCAALGLALSYAPRNARFIAILLMAGTALAASFLVFPAAWQDGIFLGCWVSVLLTVLSVHLPGGAGPRLAAAFGLNAGFWIGAVVSTAGSRWDLFKALPVVLVCIPGAWLVATKRGIAIKVVTSWLIAISILAAALPLTPTPGYKPDHMD